MEQTIVSNKYMVENGKKYDILKFVLAILIVGIHSSKTGMIFRPVLRLAVPLFFIVSSYLFFWKQSTMSSRQERIQGLKKYSKRILTLYFFWFILLLPFTIYYREWYVDFGSDVLLNIVKRFFFGSTFIASWYLMASLIGVGFVWLLSLWKVRDSLIIGIGIVAYALCCMVSSYYNMMDFSPGFIEAYKSYTNIFSVPFNSFPCSILFVGIGKLLAERQLAFPKKWLVAMLLFSMVLLYVEFFVIHRNCVVVDDDCFFLLPVVCSCIFMLIGQSRPCEINCDAKKLRSYSIIIYCSHGTILSVLHSIINYLNINELNDFGLLAMFIATIILSIAIGKLFMCLKNRRYCGWLRYSH